MQKEICDQLISECEQSFQKMELDFYEVMKKAPEVVERWKKFYPLAQKGSRRWVYCSENEESGCCEREPNPTGS